MSKLLVPVLVSLSMAISAPVFAQDSGQAESLVLKIEEGSILTSTGGEFVSATNGQQVAVGQQLMVNENSEAKVIFDQGTVDPKDDCVIEYKRPGVYAVPSECKRAVAYVPAGNGKTALYVLGGAAVLAALIGSGGTDDTPTPPPVSLGNR